MEITFMTIHNLTPDANIMYASASVMDILGFHPDEVVGKSCFDYFHPEEVPFARYIHNRGVQLDKAAVLHYARIKHKSGQWVGCECVFTVVYEVIIACTSIFKGDARNRKRAEDAPAVRRLFSPNSDSRELMLEHLSQKFNTSPHHSLREVRAALIVNRFTRTLTVMYATNAVTSILGVTPEQFKDKSFYECMQENCLPDAIRCIESAKANDSIAYLRFWARDPRRQEDFDMQSTHRSNSDDGSTEASRSMDIDSSSCGTSQEGNSSDKNNDSEMSFTGETKNSSSPQSAQRLSPPAMSPHHEEEPYELEAVISCTSDGLAVVLRRVSQPSSVAEHGSSFFAAPWSVSPSRSPQCQHQTSVYGEPQDPGSPEASLQVDDFMSSIRDVAVVVWRLTGPDGSMPIYGHGLPESELQPPVESSITQSHLILGRGNSSENQTEEDEIRRSHEPGDGNSGPSNSGAQEN